MKMPNMIVTTLGAIVIITVLGYLNRDDGRVGSGESGLEVGVPIEHQLQKNQKTTPLPVVLRLVNNSDTAIALSADGPCKIFRYVVTTEDGGFLQAVRRADSCVDSITKSSIAANNALEEIRQVPLDTARYQAGTYTLRVKFWNYEGQAEFKLVD